MKKEPEELSSSGGTEVAPASDAGDGPARAWLHLLIDKDKPKYNKFAYRLRLFPEEKRAEWALIKQRGDARTAEAFVDDVVAGKRKTIVEEKVVEKESKDQTKKTWTPFKKAAEWYGEDVVTVMIKAKTVLHRRMAKVPESADIKWPYYLEVKLDKESEVDSNTTKDIVKNSSTVEDPDDEVRQAFDGTWAAAQRRAKAPRVATPALCDGQMPAAAPSEAESVGEPTTEEALKVAINAIRKAHSLFDKLERETTVVLEESRGNEYSGGCKLELTLTQQLKDGRKLDEQVRQYETSFAKGATKVRVDDIEASAKAVTGLTDVMAGVRKKTVALKGLFKL